MNLSDPKAIQSSVSSAVAHYWSTRLGQQKRQKQTGKSDQGARSAVTGGAQMDGFINLFSAAIKSAGIPPKFIFQKKSLNLPGYFRPTKEWDFLVVKDDLLLVAIEVKSQVGPSFGNNFNNRTEEAMGSALDLWTAFREGAFNKGIQPFLGYMFMLEDAKGSSTPVRVREPHFHVFPEFRKASYSKRYEIFCRKLVLERLYSASSFITSRRDTGLNGTYNEPDSALSIANFINAMIGSVTAYATR